MIEKCVNCGSLNLDFGTLMSRSEITFLSESDSGSIFRKDQSVTAVCCLDCGLIMPMLTREIS